MGANHSHVSAPVTGAQLAARRRAHWLLLVILVPLGVLTILGTIWLWPSHAKSDFHITSPYATATGVSLDRGTVVRVERSTCPSGMGPGDSQNGQSGSSDQSSSDQGEAGQSGGQNGSSSQAQSGVPECLIVWSRPDAGGQNVPVEVSPETERAVSPKVGDHIQYMNYSKLALQSGAATYMFVDFVRTVPIVVLAILYAFVVVLVAKWRGLRALIGLLVAYLVLAYFIIPALVDGKPAIWVGLVGAMLIMMVALYCAHGVSARTSTALLGTLFGLLAITGLSAWAVSSAHLTGLGDESNFQLLNAGNHFTLQSVILCGLIIAGLGVLNDVTITQASAVWELHELAPQESARRLFTGAMRIGRDHIASTVYTIAFAYAGAALPLLIIVSGYDPGFLGSLSGGVLAEEVVRTLVGSIGLVLAIPVTTAIAVLVVKAVSVGTSVQAVPASAGPAAPEAPDLDQSARVRSRRELRERR